MNDPLDELDALEARNDLLSLFALCAFAGSVLLLIEVDGVFRWMAEPTR